MVTTRAVFQWMVRNMPILTSTVTAICGHGLQEIVWCNLRDQGPTTVHELAERLGEDRDRVRNALYRLICMRAVKCLTRIPSPIGASRPRVVWCAVDRDGTLFDAKQRADW